jgi:hypothetical protein
MELGEQASAKCSFHNNYIEAMDMKVGNFKTQAKNGRKRITAAVIWEDCDRPAQDIYFETPTAYGEGLFCNPHAFLVVCIIPAMCHGERRLHIDAAVCPELRDGLMTAMMWLRHWFGPDRKLTEIESRAWTPSGPPRAHERSGFFLSGGVDSLAALRVNRLNYPLEHPGSYKDGLCIHGIEKGKEQQHFERALCALSEITREDGEINLIPVYTNMRQLDDDTFFWTAKFQAAALSAVAHAFARRLSSVTIPATYDLTHLDAYGSHPVLDPNYGSSDLRIRHDGILFSRLEKTRLIADWEIALRNVRVCNHPKQIKPEALNCGRCEKCLRTRLALRVLGKGHAAPAFPQTEFSEEDLLERLYIKEDANTSYVISCYQDLITASREAGDHELARQIEHFIARRHPRGGPTSLEFVKRRLRKVFANLSTPPSASH